MATQQVENLTEQFRRFIIDACDTDPGHIIADGRWHRFRIADTRHKGSKPGRYLLHLDGRPNGIFMDWRSGSIRHKWRADGNYESIDRDEVARRRSARQVDQMRAWADAAADAVEFWKSCGPLNDGLHPYLEAKGIAAQYGTRQGSGERFGLGDVPCVIIPLSDADGKPMSLQAIREDGERRFWPGTTHEGAHFMVGADTGGQVVFCEGFSTAASIHGATGLPVVMCVTSANMAAVARWAGHKWVGRDMIVAGDDDWHLLDHPKVKRNVGKDAALQMAKMLPGRAIFPDMAGLVTDGGDDFNDMAREYGLDEVASVFSAPATQAGATHLPLIWFDENQPLLSGNWIIKNVLPANAFCTIIGHPGCGKSFLALDMALHIAAGIRWQDRKTERGLVLYLAAEGQRGQQNRVEAWKRHYGAQGLSFAMIPVAVNLRDKEADLPKLYETIRAALALMGIPLSVLVVDTLNRTFGGGDENGTDMSEYVANVGQIQAEFGCTAIVVHHVPKNSETVSERGHGSLRGAIETSLVVSHDQDSGVRSVLCKKQKDAEDGWRLQFKLNVIELGLDEDGDPVTSCVVIPTEEAPVERFSGPRLSATQRGVLNELLATVEAKSVGLPSDFPVEMRGSMAGGRVASRKEWQARWAAIAAGDMSATSAGATFRRAVTDLLNHGLIGAWNDFVWVVNK